SPRSALALSVQGGLDRTGLGGEDADAEPPANVRGRLLGARLDLVSQLASNVTLRAGLDSIWTYSKIELNTEGGDGGGRRPPLPSRAYYEDVQSPVRGFPSNVLIPLDDARELEAARTLSAQLFSRHDVASGAWLGVAWKPVPRITVTPG